MRMPKMPSLLAVVRGTSCSLRSQLLTLRSPNSVSYTEAMIQGLVQLFLFQALGELLSKFVLPFIPGPVLGTATVSLAIPIYKGFASLKGRMGVLLLSLLAGGITSVLTAVGMSRWLGVDEALVRGLVAKSVTAPIAMGVAERVQASPTLTAIFSVSTGILGAVLGRYVLDALRVTAWWQRGFALGVAAHGIGTSRAFSVNAEAGAYASVHLRTSEVFTP